MDNDTDSIQKAMSDLRKSSTKLAEVAFSKWFTFISDPLAPGDEFLVHTLGRGAGLQW